MNILVEHLLANMHDGQPGGLMTVSTDDHVKETAEVVAEFLSQHESLDDVLDRSSPTSRQHFIDTGRYLWVGEVDA